MNPGYVPLTSLDLAFAASLILVNAITSFAFTLKLERALVVSSVRMVTQLSLVGLVLRWLFAQHNPLWTIGVGLIMIAAAGQEITSRQKHRFRGYRSYALGTGVLLLVGTIGTSFAIGAVIRPSPWYGARFVLPVLGMVLGNSMTGVALATRSITDLARRERSAIEAQLALGATRRQAFSGVLKDSLSAGLTPILNAMAASGLVSLPGMMTGQILAGADPVEATKYQIFIMFLISGTTALGVVIASLISVQLLSDERHRLRLDRLTSGQAG